MSENKQVSDKEFREYLKVREEQRKRDEWCEKHPYLAILKWTLEFIVFSALAFAFIVCMAAM